MSDSKSETERDVVKWARRLPLPMPRTQRELFQILGQYRPEHGLDNLLQRMDFGAVTPVHIHQVVTGQTLRSVDLVLPDPNFDPRALFRNLLVSDAFRRNVLSSFLNAFPEMGRDVFIHVPKCAGTDLINSLVRKRISLPKLLEFRDWLTDDDFLAILGGLSASVAFHDRLFVYGHMELGSYVEQVGLRPSDRIFTIIRDPMDLMVSQANYAIGRLRQDPTGRDPDSAEVLQLLGMSHMPEAISGQELKDLAVRALIHPQIAAPNRACAFLGQGHPGDYETAMRNLIAYDVEVTTTRHYDRWLRERWGIAHSDRHNKSDKIITKREVDLFYGNALQHAVSEDQKLFDVVSWALERSGKASVTGLDIVRLAGKALMRDFPESLRRDDKEDKATSVDKNLLAAEEVEFISRYACFTRVTVPGSPRVVVAHSINFGADGPGRNYLVDGWSGPESTFTWTNATESRICLPPFPRDVVCVIRLTGSPMIAKEKVPFQRVEVLVNGVPVGAARVREVALIEFEVPPQAVKPGEPFELILRLPHAARPSAVSGVKDDRLLGFALRNLSILHVQPVPNATMSDGLKGQQCPVE